MHSPPSSEACLKSNGGEELDNKNDVDISLNQTRNESTQPVEQINIDSIKSENVTDTSLTSTSLLLKRKFLSTDSMNESTGFQNEITNTNTNDEPTTTAPPVSLFDQQSYIDEELDENAKQALLKTTTEQLKKKICILKLKQLDEIRHECIENLSEQFYLEKNLNYSDMAKWKADQATSSVDENSLKLKEFVQKRFVNNGDVFALEKSLANKFKSSLPLIEHSNNILDISGATTTTTKVTSAGTSSTLAVAGSSSSKNQSIAERAKHEAQILQRISQLRKEGLWSIKRLPKLVEPGRPKTHWDFVLDEMTWMSTDFQQERKWKKNCSKKLSIAIQKHFKEKELKADLVEREEAKRLRKQANLVARDIMQFWRNVEKIIEYKQRTLMEEKRKHALDIHLNFIVDQTEKYSSWLMEGLNANMAQAASINGSVVSEPITSGK